MDAAEGVHQGGCEQCQMVTCAPCGAKTTAVKAQHSGLNYAFYSHIEGRLNCSNLVVHVAVI